ncbi:RIP metalloprotease RseP [Sedimentibacter sp. MB31-C6]|uniref:RIP metalloprotease RseP n=1 Tax=Sedimentibacter sp. MB31-C6 TaxID=3109366 RepID=UPI002DDD53AD|nr:RIP metalloprotease RseP [Sedimentibacter sp. MB36-C1]WSI04274.1 RIP metalloprotease RseP [Sedimentibacter sp. MB36-C1]
MTIIASILIFSIIVLVHEYGHYKAAKSVGIKVYEFAIGMGPVLFKKEKNDTVYSIRAIPIGGFVQMEGEEEDIKTKTSYSTKTVWQRFKVVAAGPIMNYILALVLFIIIAFSFGVAGNIIDIIDENSNEYAAGIRSGDKIISVNGEKAYIWEDIFYEITNPENDYYNINIERNGEIKEYKINNNYRKIVGITSTLIDGETTTVVTPTDMNSPAYKAGIKDKDKVIKINDVPVDTWEELTAEIDNSVGDSPIQVTVDRDGELFDYNIVPVEQISVRYNTQIEKSFVSAIASSAYKTVYYIELMFKTIVQLVTGQLGSDALGGPVMVISMVGEAAESGLLSLMSLAAFISINLGFMNLLPIPALDGSKLVFLLIEGIRGKAIPIEKEGYIHFVGFVVLIAFMLFITYKDILRIFRI